MLSPNIFHEVQSEPCIYIYIGNLMQAKTCDAPNNDYVKKQMTFFIFARQIILVIKFIILDLKTLLNCQKKVLFLLKRS